VQGGRILLSEGGMLAQMSSDSLFAIVASLGALLAASVSVIASVRTARTARRAGFRMWTNEKRLDAYVGYVRAFSALRRASRKRFPGAQAVALHEVQLARASLELLGTNELRMKADEVWMLAREVAASQRGGRSAPGSEERVDAEMNVLLSLMQDELGIARTRSDGRRKIWEG
jgi:hypothetical protein